MGWWGRAAALWATIFALAHVYWALGGDLGLAESAGTQLATDRPAWFVAGGLWGMAAACLVGAAVGEALARGRGGWLVTAAGWCAGAVLIIRAAGVEILLLTGQAQVEPGEEHWSLVLWNPWFFAGGVAFSLASLRRSRPR